MYARNKVTYCAKLQALNIDAGTSRKKEIQLKWQLHFAYATNAIENKNIRTAIMKLVFLLSFTKKGFGTIQNHNK